MLMDEVFASIHAIYTDRMLLMVSFVGLGDNVIGQKKTIDTEKRKRIESENINICDKKSYQTHMTTVLA